MKKKYKIKKKRKKNTLRNRAEEVREKKKENYDFGFIMGDDDLSSTPFFKNELRSHTNKP